MTHDVQQWLGEIKHLQQKLEEAHKERDSAFASAMNWRELYQTEAQQRRTEAALAQRKLTDLQAELEQSQGTPALPPTVDPDVPETIQALVNTLATSDELRVALTKALMECDRLTQALKAEQEHHARTRKELTAALGDTVDQLTRARGDRPSGTGLVVAQAQGPSGSDGSAKLKGNESSAAKNPSLELPLLD